MKDILIVAAMKMELPPVEGAVHTGFGKENTRRTMERILAQKKPSLVICAGLAGAVNPELKAGDIFIPERVIDYENLNNVYETDYPINRKGVLVTVPKVFEKEDKYELKKILPFSDAIDMETSAVAEIAKKRGIPFICIKGISDELSFDFSNKKLLSENIKKAVKNYSEYICGLLKKIS